MFTAQFSPIHGAGAAFVAPAYGTDMGRIHNESMEVDLVVVAQMGQQGLVNLVPDTGGLPVAQAVPASHATAATHLLGQIFPGQAGLEDKDEAGKDFAIVQERASAVGLGGMRRSQGLGHSPAFLRGQWLGHGAALSKTATR